MRFPALIDGKAGAYGVAFPDLPGCVDVGCTVGEAIRNAADAVTPDAESPRLNPALDAGVAEAINAGSKRRGMTRKDYPE